MTNRDEFTNTIKWKLEQQVASTCSWPECDRITTGASIGAPEGVVRIGVAAHITAASPGGPRYDASLAPQQRKSVENGIWLCSNHARLIDVDDSAYPVEKLREWKRLAKERAALRVAHGHAAALPVPFLEGSLDAESAQNIRHRLLGLAVQDLHAFRNDERWPVRAIELSLRIKQGDSTQAFDLCQIAAKVTAYADTVLTAPPGMGKSTTLVQIAEIVAAEGSSVPCLVPLPEWAALPGTPLLSAVLRHAAFAPVREDELRLLASEGALVLLLDGWNELDTAARQRVRLELQALRRDYPNVSRVIATRSQSDVPVFPGGLTCEVERLSGSQQHEIARALRGAAGEQLLGRAIRTEGVRDLTRIPLFLSAMLAADDITLTPQTKEGVLATFVDTEDKRAQGRGDTLRQATLGFHREVLRAIATYGVAAGSTTIKEESIRPVILGVYTQLHETHQIASLPQPHSVLDVLVAEHLLVRAANGALMFQHQQFQEWFASFEVESLMRSAKAGDIEAAQRLRMAVLDQRGWEESILFACERMTSEPTGQAAAAQAVRLSLAIDPMLAADMIYAAPQVWPLVETEVMSFVDRWHTPGVVDRAVGFMNTTGRPEFLPRLAPLFQSQDSQIHLEAYRAGHRFPPSLFGPLALEHVLAYPAQQQIELLLECIQRGGVSGAAFAVDVASATSLDVQTAVAEELYYRSEDAELTGLLSNASDSLWQALAQSVELSSQLPEEFRHRLSVERQRYLTQQTEPARRVHLLLQPANRPDDFEPQFDSLLRDPNLGFDTDGVQSDIHRAAREFPSLVANALLDRAEAHLSLPHGANDIVRSADIVHDSPVLQSVLLENIGEHAVQSVAAAVAGPATVALMLDALLEARLSSRDAQGRIVEEMADKYFRLRELLRACPFNSLVSAIETHLKQQNLAEIEVLANLLSDEHGSRRHDLDSATQATCDQVLHVWAERLISAGGNRSVAAAVGAAIGSAASQALAPALLRLLDYDLLQRAMEREQNDRQRAMISHSLQYQRALMALGGETIGSGMLSLLINPHFASEAATVLRELKMPAEKSDRIGVWVDHSFLGMMARQDPRMSFSRTTEPDAEAILAAADGFSAQGNAELAMRMTAMVVHLSCGDPTDRVDALLRLPGSTRVKQDLVKHYVLAGGTPKHEAIVAAVQELLDVAPAQPWMLHPEQGPLPGWLALLPFSDRPESAASVLALLPDELRAPFRQRELLRAMGIAGGAANEDALFELIRHDARYLEFYEWWQALRALERVTAAARILPLLTAVSGAGGLRTHGAERLICDVLANAISQSEVFRKQAYEYLQDGVTPGSELMVDAIAQHPDITGIILLIRHQAKTSDQPTNALHRALSTMAIGERASTAWPGSFYRFGVPVVELRRRLYHMTFTEGGNVQSIAIRCLEALDCLRDEWGTVDQEPRHPDIASGNPWPLVGHQISHATNDIPTVSV